VFGKADTTPVSLADVAAGTGGFVLDGETAGDFSGSSVSAAGDVDGDGFADLIVGAYRADPNGLSEAGRSYVVFGGNFTGAVTHAVTPGADVLVGTASADAIVAGRGDDLVTGAGGADVLYCGPGDDAITIGDGGFARIDGGTGSDTFVLDAAGMTLDLTVVPDHAVVGIETIDITGTGDNGLVLALGDLLWISDTSNTLTVIGDVGDTLDADLSGGGFIDNGSVAGFTEYTNGILVLRVSDEITANVVL
jgi:hypothetical protein